MAALMLPSSAQCSHSDLHRLSPFIVAVFRSRKLHCHDRQPLALQRLQVDPDNILFGIEVYDQPVSESVSGKHAVSHLQRSLGRLTRGRQVNISEITVPLHLGCLRPNSIDGPYPRW